VRLLIISGEPELGLQLTERKRLYLLKHPETEHGGDRKSNRQLGNLKENARFTAEAAKISGKSERVIQGCGHSGKRVGARSSRERHYRRSSVRRIN
jgi:hypothetical protein